MAGPDGTLGAPAPPMPGRRRQAPKTGRRSARKQRIPTRAIFSELADLAAIPRSAYALEQESDGAICLLRTEEGFEVFSAADGARHEVRSFDDEEAAYFYLFGVLAAEAVRNGSLTPPRYRRPADVPAAARPGWIHKIIAGETISAPSRRKPRAVRALIVPSGTSSRSAISRWVRSA